MEGSVGVGEQQAVDACSSEGAVYHLELQAVETGTQNSGTTLVPVEVGSESILIDASAFVDARINEAADGNEDAQENADVCRWTDNSTRMLISLYPKFKEMVDQGKLLNQRRMWGKIAEQITSDLGYKYTAAQVENRWKTLERAYKRKIAAVKNNGRIRQLRPYERELEEVLIKKRNSFTEAVISASGLTLRQQLQQHSGAQVSILKPVPSTSTTVLHSATPVKKSSDHEDDDDDDDNDDYGVDDDDSDFIEEMSTCCTCCNVKDHKKVMQALRGDAERRHEIRAEFIKKSLKLQEEHLELAKKKEKARAKYMAKKLELFEKFLEKL